MHSEKDLQSLHNFLRGTGEGNLKRMMVGGRMTEAHLKLLLKVARAGSATEFTAWAQGSSFPKIKMNPAEQALREAFWKLALDTCVALGLIEPSTGALAPKAA